MFVQNGTALTRLYMMICSLKWAETKTEVGGATRITFCNDCRTNRNEM